MVFGRVPDVNLPISYDSPDVTPAEVRYCADFQVALDCSLQVRSRLHGRHIERTLVTENSSLGI